MVKRHEVETVSLQEQNAAERPVYDPTCRSHCEASGVRVRTSREVARGGSNRGPATISNCSSRQRLESLAMCSIQLGSLEKMQCFQLSF